MSCLHSLANWVNTERLNILLAALNILLAALTLFMAWVTFKLGHRTLSYMKDRDFELDTRNGWIEIHKAMLNLRVHRSFIMLPNLMGAYGPFGGNMEESIANYTLARSQLLGQLDRLNDDPLLIQISEFLNANLLTKDWQTERFERQFDAFVHQVAFKARPK
jgi:hypothetical protein